MHPLAEDLDLGDVRRRAQQLDGAPPRLGHHLDHDPALGRAQRVRRVDREEPAADPDARTLEPDPERVALAAGYAAEHVGPHEPTGLCETCLITSTPDEDFVIDRRGSIVIGSPCSGHGFKFAPLIGRILADLATAQPTPVPIERFLATRLALRA